MERIDPPAGNTSAANGDHGWLRTELVAHPGIGYVAALFIPVIGLALGIALLAWRETRRGLATLAIAVAVIALCAASGPHSGAGSSPLSKNPEAHSRGVHNKMNRCFKGHRAFRDQLKCTLSSMPS